ncbi:AlpA family phage regulatory protein [Pseudomaricurvus alkylphenolicus]|uniref:helix-turn-helix transcriptional regulator n=1 Tax=Pseudomaricurvus alkylphenolicus TaxID=1306991 RepID=UPI00141D9C80|nr:AlpA family phage regulatory protein [Pseudomaricurvus alkylphenolicus]NIB39078.1 AlpA family phage regulatory protein [Pseudomaricurvus alkylphenolicus]
MQSDVTSLINQIIAALPVITLAALHIDREPEILNRAGYSRSTFRNRIKEGLMPSPISLGARAVGWPRHEIDVILGLTIADQPDAVIKAVVTHLHEQRKNLISGTS